LKGTYTAAREQTCYKIIHLSIKISNSPKVIISKFFLHIGILEQIRRIIAYDHQRKTRGLFLPVFFYLLQF